MDSWNLYKMVLNERKLRENIPRIQRMSELKDFQRTSFQQFTTFPWSLYDSEAHIALTIARQKTEVLGHNNKTLQLLVVNRS